MGSGIGVSLSSENESASTNDLVQSLRQAVYTKVAHAKPHVAQANPTHIPDLVIKAEAPKVLEAEPVAVESPAPARQPATSVTKAKASLNVSPKKFAAIFASVFMLGMAAIWYGNQSYAPEMYSEGGMAPAAQAHAENKNYAVFDLNINIRALREEQLKRMTHTPEVIILGASQWQELHKELFHGVDFYNAHIHRDYWEDLPGMVELLTRYNRLPQKLIIAVRDRQFKPVEARKDWLWEPGIPNYRAMAQRLGIEPENYFRTMPYHRIQALISLPMLFENFTRWYNSAVHPGPTIAARMNNMEMLLPDGSIMWSKTKLKLFTPERTASEVSIFAKANLNDPPFVEPKGVEAFVAVLDYLKAKGVSVYLVNPPFNPEFYDQIAGTPYADGLARVDSLVHNIATERHLPLIGGFNPHQVGCTADMYIDSEHSSPRCLQKIVDEFLSLGSLKGPI